MSVSFVSEHSEDCGRNVSEYRRRRRSKKKTTWEIKIGEKTHTIDIITSILSGKRRVLINGVEVFFEKKQLRLRSRLNINFQFNHVLDGHFFKISRKENTVNEFELRIDNLSLEDLKNYRFGQEAASKPILTSQPNDDPFAQFTKLANQSKPLKHNPFGEFDFLSGNSKPQPTNHSLLSTPNTTLSSTTPLVSYDNASSQIRNTQPSIHPQMITSPPYPINHPPSTNSNPLPFPNMNASYSQVPYPPTTNTSYSPITTPYSPMTTPSLPMNTILYPSATTPHTPTNIPYSPNNTPYSPNNTPYSPNNTPYSPTNTPYPPTNTPYSPNNTPYSPMTPPFPAPLNHDDFNTINLASFTANMQKQSQSYPNANDFATSNFQINNAYTNLMNKEVHQNSQNWQEADNSNQQSQRGIFEQIKESMNAKKILNQVHKIKEETFTSDSLI